MNAGRENGGPSKSRGLKMQHMKILDTKIDGMKQLITCSEVTGR